MSKYGRGKSVPDSNGLMLVFVSSAVLFVNCSLQGDKYK